MAKTKKTEEIEEIDAEVIPSVYDEGDKVKKKPGRPKKVDGFISVTDIYTLPTG